MALARNSKSGYLRFLGAVAPRLHEALPGVVLYRPPDVEQKFRFSTPGR